MNFSDKELKEVEKLASLYMKISDMAVILDIPPDVLRTEINDKSSPVAKAYRKGKTASKLLLHKQEMELARVGSPLALDNMRNNLLDMEDDE